MDTTFCGYQNLPMSGAFSSKFEQRQRGAAATWCADSPRALRAAAAALLLEAGAHFSSVALRSSKQSRVSCSCTRCVLEWSFASCRSRWQRFEPTMVLFKKDNGEGDALPRLLRMSPLRHSLRATPRAVSTDDLSSTLSAPVSIASDKKGWN